MPGLAPRLAARAIATSAPLVVLLALLACEDEKKPAMPPVGPGVGYSDVRVLSHKDCEQLTNRFVENAVDEELLRDGGAPTSVDANARLEVEAEVRRKMRADIDEWIEKKCVGRKLPSAIYRCMRDATTPGGFDACAAAPDAGEDGAGG